MVMASPQLSRELLDSPVMSPGLMSGSAAAQPLVSIAVCVFNGELYLREQLDSLLQQTHPNIEIIAVDDCSTDGSLKILEQYAQREPRIRVYANAKNLGLKANFAVAASHCRGEYIAPCDQDDIWLPNKIAMLLDRIGNYALVYCDSKLVNEQGLPLGTNVSDLVTTLSTNDPGNLLFYNCASGHAMLFRREVLERAAPFPDEYVYDWWLAVVATTMGGIHFVNQPLVHYRQHAGSITDLLKRRQHQHQDKPDGYRLQMLRTAERRIDLLIGLPGTHQSSIARLKQLWRKRERQWLSLGLAIFMARNGKRLFATVKRANFLFLMRRALYYMWGVRTKRFTNHRAFTLHS